MRRLLALVLFVSLTLFASGCFHNTIVVSPDYDPSTEIPNVEELRIHLFDIIPLGSPINMEEVCPTGAGVVETRSFISLYVFGFSQARVYCNRV
jgi:hypothetical protein